MDLSTPNLPSRDINKTKQFYANIGFSVAFQDAGWMILRQGTIEIEFFHIQN